MNLISERYLDDGCAIMELTELQKEHVGIFMEKCRSGEYRFRDRECECGNGNFEVIAKKDRYGISMDTVICKNCGLIMTSPCLDDKSNNEFYDRDYPLIYRAVEKPSEEHFLEARKTGDSIVEFIRRHKGPLSGSVLEIGCADGRNIIAFAEKGYETLGLDLSHSYVDFGRSKGLNLFCSDLSSFDFEDRQFDIIVLSHVLEHFTDLGKELGVIRSLLKEDGCLYIAVPGIKNLSFGAYQADFLLMLQNAHIFNFTKKSLCRVLKKYGFESIFCNEGIFGVFKKCEPEEKGENVYEETLDYLKRTEAAKGDPNILRYNRANDILSKYGPDEVILYGGAVELDDCVRNLKDLSPVRGFFYSDRKTPAQVMEYIRSAEEGLKCLLVAEMADLNLVYAFTELSDEVDVYSLHKEIY